MGRGATLFGMSRTLTAKDLHVVGSFAGDAICEWAERVGLDPVVIVSITVTDDRSTVDVEERVVDESGHGRRDASGGVATETRTVTVDERPPLWPFLAAEDLRDRKTAGLSV